LPNSKSFLYETSNGFLTEAQAKFHYRNNRDKHSYTINPSCISNFYRDSVQDRATIASSHICIINAILDVAGNLSSIDGKVKLLNRSFAGHDCNPDGRRNW